MVEVIKNLNQKELIDTLYGHGFKRKEIMENIEEVKKNDYLWFNVKNSLYNFVISYSKGKKKAWTITYKPCVK